MQQRALPNERLVPLTLGRLQTLLAVARQRAGLPPTVLTAVALLSLSSAYDPSEAAVAVAAVLLQFDLYSRPSEL